jgi:hypothetical protein
MDSLVESRRNPGGLTKENSLSSQPWETLKHPPDEYGFSRIEYKYSYPLSQELTSVTFVHPHDSCFQPDSATTFVRKNFESLIAFVQNRVNCEIPQELKNSDPIWPPLKRKVIESLVAASLFEKDGTHKDKEDNEGAALVLGWLAYKDSYPEVAQQCYQQLMERRAFLPERNVSTELDSSLKLGDIGLDKLVSTHATNYLPHLNNEDDARLLPRIDTDGTLRWTVHTFINGMVEPHNLGGLLKTSWEDYKYLVGMNFQDLVSQNGLPANFFEADTFWSLEPGRGLIIPENSFLILPINETETIDKYRKAGIRVVTYNPEKETLRSVARKFFSDNDLPFREGLDPRNPSIEGWRFAQTLGVRADKHSDIRKFDDSERELNSAYSALNKAKEITDKGSGTIFQKEAEEISVHLTQASKALYQEKETALSLAIANTREAILEDFFANRLPREALITAFTADLL